MNYPNRSHYRACRNDDCCPLNGSPECVHAVEIAPDGSCHCQHYYQQKKNKNRKEPSMLFVTDSILEVAEI